jgi:hypothetical protein
MSSFVWVIDRVEGGPEGLDFKPLNTGLHILTEFFLLSNTLQDVEFAAESRDVYHIVVILLGCLGSQLGRLYLAWSTVVGTSWEPEDFLI